jgi:DNA modification methylase
MAKKAKARPAAGQFELWATDDLVPSARNSRKHSREQVEQIAASMRQFGFTMPILVDEDGEIIAGHGRVMAAKETAKTNDPIKGMDGDYLPPGYVPVMVARGWTEAQKRAYRIADNKLTENSEWDDEMLKAELLFLREEDFDVKLTGFLDGELADIFGPEQGDTDEDAAPEVAARAVSRPGDVWIMGDHRIICGDCTSAETVKALLGDEKPHLMVTDPPYGVEYDPKWRAEAGVNKNKAKMGEVLNDNRADWREAWALFPGDVIYVWHAGLFASVVAESIVACGFDLRSQIIWAKDRFALSRGNYHWHHEPCWYAVRKGAKAHWHGDRSQSTLWSIKAREDGGVGHGTQKPVECMRKPIENNSAVGDAVYEPFSGSGTTIIAAEQTKRRCLAVELNPLYVDVAVKRWQEFTGRKAKLEATGQTFAKVADERYDPATDGAESYNEFVKAKREELVNGAAAE